LPSQSHTPLDLFVLPQPAELNDLYQKCLEEMLRFKQADAQAQKKAHVSARSFGPLVPTNQLLDAPPSHEDSDAIQKSKNEWVAEKYRLVLKHFKAASPQNFDQVCQILAMWLKDEGICNPEDLLPEDIFKRLTALPAQLFGKYRPAEMNYAGMVMAVVPYFELAMKTYKHLHAKKEPGINEKLEELGFDPDAVRVMVGTERSPRSATRAASRFVADRTELDEDTLATAFSRIYRQKPKVPRKSNLGHKKDRAV
jgi:hypothetical protein